MTKKGANSALSASAKGNGGKGRNSKSAPTNPDAVCYNCECKGHYKEDCWRKGGGKEGQGPNQKKQAAVETQVSMGAYRPYSKTLYWTC
jgi:hypothetical protein